MVSIENECVECGKPCFSECPYKAVKHYYCDHCGNETDKLYEFEGEELCLDCIIETLTEVE